MDLLWLGFYLRWLYSFVTVLQNIAKRVCCEHFDHNGGDSCVWKYNHHRFRVFFIINEEKFVFRSLLFPPSSFLIWALTSIEDVLKIIKRNNYNNSLVISINILYCTRSLNWNNDSLNISIKILYGTFCYDTKIC